MKSIRIIILLTLLTLLAAGQSAWAQSTSATFPVEVTFRGAMGSGKYNYKINSNIGYHSYDSGVQDLTEPDCVYFSDQEFDIGRADVPLTMTVNGAFTFDSTVSDASVYSSNAFFSFTSGSKYITGISVSTISGTQVSFTVHEATNFYRKIIIPANTTFGKFTLTLATHTPLDYGATISGIEDTYLDDGVNRPVPTVTYQEGSSPAITLTEGVDYTVSYNVGSTSTSGTVIVTGMGQYIGSKSKSYNIRQLQLSDFTKLGDGSYEIATKQDLDNLAKFVNNGNNCSGVTFRQTADIAYTYTNAWDNIFEDIDNLESNFTPIGRYGKSFRGTYDGQNNTISGIRVDGYFAGSNHDDQSLGLFGYVSGGTVQNVVLRDSYIRGDQDLGGIVGYLYGGTVSGCTLHHVTVSTFWNSYTTYQANVVVGNLASGTVSTSHYRDCCLGRRYKGNGESYSRQHNEPQNDVFALTLGTDVTASKTSGESVTIDDVTYYTEGSTFTLGYSGNMPGANVVFSATAGSIDGSILTMPAEDVTVSVTITSCSLTLTQGTKDGVTAYWGTFYDGTHRYILPEGAAAYTMGTDYKLYRLGTDGRTIPAGTAVIIISDKESITLNFDDSGTPITVNGWDNILKGSSSAVNVSGLSGTPYVLGVVNDVFGFHPFTGTSIPANKAYYVPKVSKGKDLEWGD